MCVKNRIWILIRTRILNGIHFLEMIVVKTVGNSNSTLMDFTYLIAHTFVCMT